MNNFETTILISPDISKNNLDTINSNFEKLISDEGGTIIGKEDWGLRNLAYKFNTLITSGKKFKKCCRKIGCRNLD